MPELHPSRHRPVWWLVCDRGRSQWPQVFGQHVADILVQLLCRRFTLVIILLAAAALLRPPSSISVIVITIKPPVVISPRITVRIPPYVPARFIACANRRPSSAKPPAKPTATSATTERSALRVLHGVRVPVSTPVPEFAVTLLVKFAYHIP